MASHVYPRNNQGADDDACLKTLLDRFPSLANRTNRNQSSWNGWRGVATPIDAACFQQKPKSLELLHPIVKKDSLLIYACLWGRGSNLPPLRTLVSRHWPVWIGMVLFVCAIAFVVYETQTRMVCWCALAVSALAFIFAACTIGVPCLLYYLNHSFAKLIVDVVEPGTDWREDFDWYLPCASTCM